MSNAQSKLLPPRTSSRPATTRQQTHQHPYIPTRSNQATFNQAAVAQQDPLLLALEESFAPTTCASQYNATYSNQLGTVVSGNIFGKVPEYCFHIGNNRFVIVKTHKGQVHINVRQFESKRGKLDSTRNGIALHISEFESFVSQLESIKAAVVEVTKYVQ